MANLATNKNRIVNGLDIEYDLITDLYDAMTGAKTFDDVTAQRKIDLGLQLDGALHQNSFKFRKYNPCLTNPLALSLVGANRDNNKAYGLQSLLRQSLTVGTNITLSAIGNKISVVSNASLNTPSDFARGVAFRFNTLPSNGTIFFALTKYDTTNDKREIGLQFTNFNANSVNLALYVSTTGTGGSAQAIITKNNHSIDVTKYHYYQIKRSGNDWYILIDNIIVATVNSSVVPFSSDGEYTPFGQYNSGSVNLNLLFAFHANYATSREDDLMFFKFMLNRVINIPDSLKWGSNTEQFVNADFSQGTGNDFTGWTKSESGSSTITENATDGISGSRCASFNVVSGSLVQMRQNFSSLVGKLVRLKFWAKADTAGVQMRIQNGANTIKTLTMTTDWVEYSAEFIATSNEFYISRSTGTGNYIVLVDKASLVQLGIVALYLPEGINIPSIMNSTTGGTELTALTEGMPYEITTNGSNTDFTVYGAINSNVGTRFHANQAVALIPNSGKVRLVSVSKESQKGWYNMTGSDHATVTNYPTAEIVFIDNTAEDLISIKKDITIAGTATAYDLIELPPEWMIDEISFKKTEGASVDTPLIKIDSSSDSQIGSLVGTSTIAFSANELDNMYSFAFTKPRPSTIAVKKLVVTGLQTTTKGVISIRFKKAV